MGNPVFCMLGAKKQKGWLSDQTFAKKFDFKVVDTLEKSRHCHALFYKGKFKTANLVDAAYIKRMLNK